MNKLSMKLLLLCGFFCGLVQAKQVEDFNFNWKFHLGEQQSAHFTTMDDSGWEAVRVPHDWSANLPYSQENTASSSGFKPGGIGWYRKTFELDRSDMDKVIWLEFDGIYNNSQVWINGHFAAERPYGYSSFSVPLNAHMIEGKNLISVRVDRQSYVDARWYTGSGIYRSVRLVKANETHIPMWGVQVTTPEVTGNNAKVAIKTQVERGTKHRTLRVVTKILDTNGNVLKETKQRLSGETSVAASSIELSSPKLWSLQSPTLYTARVTLTENNKVLDVEEVKFGIRSIEFDANKGFLLNGQSTKIKGVNLHHDGGAVGTAVPKALWRLRLENLKSIGVNAIRLAHNPHSPELLDLCDEMGILAIAEAFDDWQLAKAKSLVFLSDNAAKGKPAASYTEHFNQWSEADLKDLVRRDINHPSVIMWSIGNEIEWTYPYYPAAAVYDVENAEYYASHPVYDPKRVKQSFQEKLGAKPDHLVLTAEQLSKYVKQVDSSRLITAGLVIPSVGFVSGYTDTLDVVGFNYRAVEYDAAHKTYPDTPIYGSENWGSWPEWKAVLDREFVPGIFVWTGYAYKGEAGPWPRKGLEISFFDFAGNKTPRGHQFESFWVDKPKVYLATMPLEQSEYQLNEDNQWVFKERVYAEPKMQWLRPWEWYGVEERWQYQSAEPILVQVYSNTEQSELFLNGTSLGKQTLTDENNRILFWQVPYQGGELKVVGYDNGKSVAEHRLTSFSDASSIRLVSNKKGLVADQYDLAQIRVEILDKDGNLVLDSHGKLKFSLTGPATLLAVDNGWENSVEPSYKKVITPHNGKAMALIQSTSQAGNVLLTVGLENGPAASIEINIK